jgi:hypothetical protein
MFIIVESGSTKADWVASGLGWKSSDVQNRWHQSFYTGTQFPFMSDEALQDMVGKADDIFFYGAGADDLSSPGRIQKWLAALWF